jgi:hypothetical protein
VGVLLTYLLIGLLLIAVIWFWQIYDATNYNPWVNPMERNQDEGWRSGPSNSKRPRTDPGENGEIHSRAHRKTIARRALGPDAC